jgi:glycerol-3-phosphate dehydrogenase
VSLIQRPALSDIAKQKFDVVVIGGGINGAGIAREAQFAGYRTLLLERDDFGAGTTSRATRLIHGGLRYLEHGEMGLVSESLGEREALLRTAPHLVKPLRLLVPVYAGDARPPWKVRAGLMLYDLLSLQKSLPRNHGVGREHLNRIAPCLNRDNLRAAYLMSDAQVEFPERLVIEAVRDLVEAGGVALNHVVATGIVSPGHRLKAVVVREALAGGAQAHSMARREIETKVIVNAAGPWVDEVLAGTDAERHERLIGGTKGSHLVVDWPDGPKHAIFASAKADGRPFFILPWYRYTLVGTTDIRYDGDPSDARCAPEELAYLLDEATHLFPSTPLRREHVLYTYSGVRPLPYTPARDEAAITRKHFIVDHKKTGGPDGLLSIVGGKLTTYRSLARIALPAIRKHAKPSGAAVRREEGGGKMEDGDALAMYGSRRADVEELIARDPSLAEPICAHNPETMAQVAYAVEHELAVTLGDVLLRRLRVGWSACHALDGADRAAGAMAMRFGWTEDHTALQVVAYHAELRKSLVRASRREGDRVRVSVGYHWAKGALGTMGNPMLGDETPARFGPIRSLWVDFDVPQIGADGDGPYAGGQIDELFLDPAGV